MIWPESRRLEHDWKIGDKENWGEDIWMDFSEWLENVKILYLM